MKPSRPCTPDLQTLVGLFYESPEELGDFEEVAPLDMPPRFRQLLAHNEHMTVTVEAYHRSPVDVHVLATFITATHYVRKILLTRQSDEGVVQFGIVRLDFEYVSPEVRAEIESQRIPLGRVLIQHQVLREVQLASLWKLRTGEDLRGLFGLDQPQVTYGRTALIYCNGEPAVELLEIVTPE